MSVSSATGTISIATSDALNTTYGVTTGFEPKVIFFWSGGGSSATDAVVNADNYSGFGYAISTSGRRFVGGHSTNGVTTTVEICTIHDAAVFVASGSTDGQGGLLDVSAIASDGFTCIIDHVFPVNIRVHYLAVGGDSITNTAVGSFQNITTLGTQDITDVGFQPDFIILSNVSYNSFAPPDDYCLDSTWGMGAYDGTRNLAVKYFGDNAVTTSLMETHGGSPNCYTHFTIDGLSITGAAAGSTMLSNGFRINITNSMSTVTNNFYLAIKGGNFRVDETTTATNGTAWSLSGWGFRPSSLLFLSGCGAENASETFAATKKGSIGAAASASSRNAAGFWSTSGVTTTHCEHLIEHDAVYVESLGSTAVDAAMDVESIDSGGVTLVMDDPGTNARWVGLIAFGPGTEPVTGSPGDIFVTIEL